MRKVLYALEDYPVVSETYVETEIDYFLERGIEIAVWCRRQDPGRSPWRVPVFEGPMKSAAGAFKPDLVHVHWFPIAPSVLGEGVGVPVTVRGHSFEFSPGVAKAIAQDPQVAAVFMFPHFVEATFRGANPGRVIPLPSAYSERLYYPEEKVPGTVVRATAGLATKDIDLFLDTAKICPEGTFTLITSRPKEDSSYLNNLIGRNSSMGSPVKILIDIPREKAAEIVRGSQVCLRSSNLAGHPYGMPISIAEAMGAGAVPVVRDHMSVRAYVGDAGLYFNTTQEAADRVRQVLSDKDLYQRLQLSAIDRAKRHASEAVLPRMLEVWSKACGW